MLVEPFSLWRPDRQRWEDGFAQQHQARLTQKNKELFSAGNFKLAIKVVKHLRDLWGAEAVSFHLECLLLRTEGVVAPMDPTGIEPVTPCLQSRCSPS